MKAVIIDTISEYIGPELEKYGFRVDHHMLPSTEELAGFIGEYELLVMRVDPFIDRSVIDAGKKLKAIAVCSAGTNHIDLKYAADKGVIVMNALGCNSNAVAELTMSKILDMNRYTVAANNEVKYKNIWNKYKWIGRELRGQTLGIIGLGRIGSRVGELAQAYGMLVIAYDPYLSQEEAAAKGVDLVSLEELLMCSDVITIHVPLTDETKNLISYPQIEMMKEDAIVINTAHGGILDEQAIYENLKSGKLSGLSVDVLASELDSGGLTIDEIHLYSPLFQLDNTLISPHIGGATKEAYDAIGIMIVDKVAAAFGLKK
ncbi:MAG: NAD(P)-dependent oxidoreductase [Peptococcaceae bacterium]